MRELGEDARRIFAAAVRAADPARAVARHLSVTGWGFHVRGRAFPVERRLFVISVGKAAVSMALSAREILGPLVSGGLVVTKAGHTKGWVPAQSFELIEAEHPVPGDASLEAASRCEDVLGTLEAGDVLLLLISGGASSLLADPSPPVRLADLRETTSLLLRAGADIGEINAVRKHLSRLKGGNLALRAAPARVVVLALSDVIGDALDVIGSGPASPDPTTFADALRVVRRRDLETRLPASVRDHLERGARGEIAETPKPDDPVFSRVFASVIGSNRDAMRAAVDEARLLGYQPVAIDAPLVGEARDAGARCGRMARDLLESGEPVASPACLVFGGETTVTVRGNGRGGRSQELALAAALEIDSLPGVAILAAGTDGTDGTTDAAGAIVDGESVRKAQAAGADARRLLEENDSHAFHQKAGSLVVTGPTGTNVNDLVLVLYRQPA